MLAELDVPQGTNAPVLTKSFLWGLDLSGTPDQAGGIGGLLAISQHSTLQLSTHLPCFDGNGNVMALVHAGSGQPSARYEYAPFGEPLRVTGDAALLNPFRFSTKYTDDETGLLYYGYRYYSPTLAKWLNRDPLGEEGGLNLYAFCLNNPVNSVDALGQFTLVDVLGTSADDFVQKGEELRRANGIKNKVKDAVRAYEDSQEFIGIVMDAAQGDVDDLIINLWQASNDSFAKGAGRGKGEHLHHILPKSDEFSKMFTKAGLDPHKFTVGVSEAIHRKMHSGKDWGGSGGMWNGLWRKFADANKQKDPSKEDILEFAGNMMSAFGIKQPLQPYKK